jgi:hypothetical protein
MTTGEGQGTIQSLVTTTSNGIWVKYLGMNLTGMSFRTISPLPCHTLHLYRKPARAQKHLTRHLPGKDGGRKTSTLLSALLPAKKAGRDTVTIPPLPGLSSFTEEPYPVLNVAGGSCTSTEADTKQIAPASPVFVTENIARFAPTSFVHPINEIARRGLAFWAVHPRTTMNASNTETQPAVASNIRFILRLRATMPNVEHQRWEPAAPDTRVVSDLNGWLPSAECCGSAPW